MMRINLMESRAKRVKRFMELLTEATLATGVVVALDWDYDDASLCARASEHEDGDHIYWDRLTQQWEFDR
jgi:hypothetical protein